MNLATIHSCYPFLHCQLSSCIKGQLGFDCWRHTCISLISKVQKSAHEEFHFLIIPLSFVLRPYMHLQLQLLHPPRLVSHTLLFNRNAINLSINQPLEGRYWLLSDSSGFAAIIVWSKLCHLLLFVWVFPPVNGFSTVKFSK